FSQVSRCLTPKDARQRDTRGEKSKIFCSGTRRDQARRPGTPQHLGHRDVGHGTSLPRPLNLVEILPQKQRGRPEGRPPLSLTTLSGDLATRAGSAAPPTAS